MAKKIELLPAYWWHCWDCGAENYGRMVSAEGIAPEEEDGEWLLAPETVTCKDCGAEFETE